MLAGSKLRARLKTAWTRPLELTSTPPGSAALPLALTRSTASGTTSSNQRQAGAQRGVCRHVDYARRDDRAGRIRVGSARDVEGHVVAGVTAGYSEEIIVRKVKRVGIGAVAAVDDIARDAHGAHAPAVVAVAVFGEQEAGLVGSRAVEGDLPLRS